MKFLGLWIKWAYTKTPRSIGNKTTDQSILIEKTEIY